MIGHTVAIVVLIEEDIDNEVLHGAGRGEIMGLDGIAVATGVNSKFINLLDEHPATYITSFHLPQDKRDTLIKLVRRFPSVTIIDVDALVSKVREIMERADQGMRYVFLFTLLAGFTVLLAAIQSTLDERRHESAILRTLGADRRAVRRGLLAEFLTLGALAGCLAGRDLLAGNAAGDPQVTFCTPRRGRPG